MSVHADVATFTAAMVGLGAAADGGSVGMWSVIGALAGGVLAAGMMDGTGKARALRWFMCAVAGSVFTPGLMVWLNIPPDEKIAMGLAGAVSFCSWGVLWAVQQNIPSLAKEGITWARGMWKAARGAKS